MAQVKLAWHGEELKQRLMTDVQRRMVAAESLAVQAYQAAVGRPYPPASQPGEFPRRRTGRLQTGIRANVNRIRNDRVQLTLTNVARSPSGFNYPAALESGTGRMAPRPHLRPVLRLVFARLKQLLNAR